MFYSGNSSSEFFSAIKLCFLQLWPTTGWRSWCCIHLNFTLYCWIFSWPKMNRQGNDRSRVLMQPIALGRAGLYLVLYNVGGFPWKPHWRAEEMAERGKCQVMGRRSWVFLPPLARGGGGRREGKLKWLVIITFSSWRERPPTFWAPLLFGCPLDLFLLTGYRVWNEPVWGKSSSWGLTKDRIKSVRWMS